MSAQNIKRIVLFVAALLLGVLVSTHWPIRVDQSPAVQDNVSRTIRQLEVEQDELKHTISELRAALDHQQAQVSGNTTLLQEVRAELDQQKLRAGLVDVRGAGMRVLLDDGSNASESGPPNDDLIHDYDLRDVINVLWMAGAEAIAVNDERIVNNTSIYCVGSTIMINDTRISPPYAVNALGDSARLQDYLRNPGYLGELKVRADRFAIEFELIQVEMMTLPTYRGSFPQQFARPGS